MTLETPTPETDDLAVVCYGESGIEGGNGFCAVPIKECRRLERERDAARQAIAEAASHLSGFLGFHADSLSLDQVRALSATLAKLKPFITDAAPPNT